MVLISTLNVVAFAPAFAQTPDSWSVKASLPGFINLGRATVLDGQVYIVTYPNTLWVYDPTADIWTKQSTVPLPEGTNLNQYGLAACANKLYVIGEADNLSKTYFVNRAYNVTSNTWEIKSPIEIHHALWQADVFNGKIYLFGLNSVYDPENDSWSPIPQMPTPVYDYASAVLNNKIYVIGGFNGSGGPGSYLYRFFDLVQIFEPATDKWTLGTPILKSMSGMAATATTGSFAAQRILVAGGWDEFNFYNYDQIYDPQTGNWSYAAPLPIAVRDLCLVNVNDTLYALGGQNASYQSIVTNFRYVPADWSLSNVKTTTSITAPSSIWKSQPLQIRIEISPKPPTANDTFTNYALTLQLPDNSTQTLHSDANNSAIAFRKGEGAIDAYLSISALTPQIGNFTLTFNFGGQTFPDGRHYLNAQNQTSFEVLPKNPPPTQTPTSTPTPSPSVPEFPTLIVLPIVVTVTLLAALFIRRKKQ